MVTHRILSQIPLSLLFLGSLCLGAGIFAVSRAAAFKKPLLVIGIIIVDVFFSLYIYYFFTDLVRYYVATLASLARLHQFFLLASSSCSLPSRSASTPEDLSSSCSRQKKNSGTFTKAHGRSQTGVEEIRRTERGNPISRRPRSSRGRLAGARQTIERTRRQLEKLDLSKPLESQ